MGSGRPGLRRYLRTVLREIPSVSAIDRIDLFSLRNA